MPTAMHIITIVTIAAFAVPRNQIIFEMIMFFAQFQFALRNLSSFKKSSFLYDQLSCSKIFLEQL